MGRGRIKLGGLGNCFGDGTRACQYHTSIIWGLYVYGSYFHIPAGKRIISYRRVFINQVQDIIFVNFFFLIQVYVYKLGSFDKCWSVGSFIVFGCYSYL